MEVPSSDEIPVEELPSSYWFGQDLDWGAGLIPARVFVELPFWLMVPDCSVSVELNSHTFHVEIRSDFFEAIAREVRDSKESTMRFGSLPLTLAADVEQYIRENQIPVLPRKCKTVLKIESSCNADAYAAVAEEGGRKNVALEYFRAYCAAHLPVMNRVIQQYRLATYDYHAYEVSPSDVPIWRVDGGKGFNRIVLFPYAGWDYKPFSVEVEERHELQFIDPDGLQGSQQIEPSPGEYELLDALTLMERGDYSGAVRRVTTAMETILYARLLDLLMAKHGEPYGRQMHSDMRDDQTKHIDRYQSQTLNPRPLPDVLHIQLKETRKLRHQIVHHAHRIDYIDRGRAQMAVDIGRWTYNWIEDDQARRDVRERNIGLRSLGRHFTLFNSEITPDGVVVKSPQPMPEKPYPDKNDV